MWSAAMWGAVSASAVMIGALFALFMKIPKKLIGLVMAFGTGVLIGAATFELIEDAVEDGGLEPTVIGFMAGAVVFTVCDWLVSSKGGAGRKRSAKGGKPDQTAAGLGIFIGTLIDAIPESIMIGASIVAGRGVSFLLVIAIFISNIPEGLSSTVGMRESGESRRKISILWTGVLVISTLASLGGYFFMEDASSYLTAVLSTFAAGGIVAMVASTMMPEAFEEGGAVTGLISALGLLVSLLLDRI